MVSSGRHPDPSAVAQALADFALQVAMDDRRQTPFAVNAQDAGHVFRGGKLDDITVIAAYVKAVEIEKVATGGPPSSPMTPAHSPLSSQRKNPTTAVRESPVAMETDDMQNLR
jgi:hypothetical protein